MDIIRKYKTPLSIIAALVLAFILYSYFHGSSSNTGAVLTSNTIAVADNTVGQSFLNQLLTLQSIQLNSEIFSNPSFNALQDFSQPVPTQPQGRPNPFAPIGNDGINQPTITSDATNNSNNLNFSTTPTATSTLKTNRTR